MENFIIKIFPWYKHFPKGLSMKLSKIVLYAFAYLNNKEMRKIEDYGRLNLRPTSMNFQLNSEANVDLFLNVEARLRLETWENICCI